MSDDDPELRDLPSLERWGDELRDATERAERHNARRRLPIRRTALAIAVILLLVPGAIATRSIWMDPLNALDPLRDPASTPAVRLADGRTGDIRWRLGAFDQTSGRCVQLQTIADGDEVGGGCSALPNDRAQIVVATGARGDVDFVFGTVASDVAEVIVTVAGGRKLRVRALTPDPGTLRRGDLPPLRGFVAGFEGGFDTTVPPLVVALDGQGHELGRQGGSGRP